MADPLTRAQRSERMRKIKRENTAPELAVRRLAHGLGLRYRLHVRTLPGTPDLVFRRHRAVIQVNGCFWHGHECKVGRRPKSNQEFWDPKIAKNRARDARNVRALRRLGWRVLLVWECETLPRDWEHLSKRIARFFGLK